MLASSDTSASTAAAKAAAIKYASHVFGRFGQGKGAMIEDAKAYSN